MTDADLTALWSAWLRDRAQIHKMINLTSAMFRAHAEAVAAAARRSPPAADAPIGRVESWEDGRGASTGFCEPGVPHQWHDTGDGQMCAACCEVRPDPYPPRGSFAGLVRAADGTLEPCGGVTHGYAPDAMPAGLKKACDARFTVYGSAGPYRPTNPEDDGDGA